MSDLVAGVRDLEKDSVAGSSALPKHRTLSAGALGALSHCREFQQTNLGENILARVENILARVGNILAWVGNILAWVGNILSWVGNILSWVGNIFSQDNRTTVQKLVEERGSTRHISFVRTLIFKCCAGSRAFI